MVPMKEVIELFDLPQILRHNARFDLNKLHWLNGEYIRQMTNDRFHELAVHALKRVGIDTNKFDLGYVKAALDTSKQKVKLFSEVQTFADFYFKDRVEFAPEVETELKGIVAKSRETLVKLREILAQLEKFDADTLGATMKAAAGKLETTIGVLVHPTHGCFARAGRSGRVFIISWKCWARSECCRGLMRH